MAASKRIALSNGGYALVDAADFDILNKYSWRRNNCGYVMHRVHREGYARSLLLHRMLMCPAKKLHVDHINGDKLDNRRCNLRIATPSQNARNSKRPNSNTTGYKGTRFLVRTQRFSAQIKVEGKLHHLGYFDTAEEAHAAYCAKATELSGEYARFE